MTYHGANSCNNQLISYVGPQLKTKEENEAIISSSDSPLRVL